MTGTVALPGWFYNIGPGRDERQVEREIRAMLAFRARRHDPLAAEVRLCEAVGYHPLPQVKGYRLVWNRSTEARRNIATYVREDLYGGRTWVDLRGTWPKTDHPGTHAPRSFLRTRVGRCVGVTAHQPPPFTRLQIPKLQREGQEALRRLLDPRDDQTWRRRAPQARQRLLERPRWVAYDANARRGDPHPSPSTLAKDIGGRLIGSRIDCLVMAGDVTCREFDYPSRVRVDGDVVPLLTDHHHAFRYVLLVDERWVA